MAAKRFLDEYGGADQDQLKQKRMKTRPSFASVIREVVMLNFLENMCSTLEPMLRRVVREEVEDGLKRRCLESMSRCPSLRIEMASDHQPTSLQLTFNKRLSLPIFTGTKIVDIDNNPLQILLVETDGDNCKVAMSLPYSIKVEILVLDGDFCVGDCNAWTKDEFTKNIVKERKGKRPLLTGESNVILRDGVAFVGDIEFTDNSSWIRSRKFRIGARVVQIQGGNTQSHVRIREAMTEPFVVKDHRGELYKKHHPPALEDEVWRLEKIGKGGVFHQKLESEGIRTVQDFLKLFIVDSSKLRRIMGNGMSDKMWEAILKHAKTCVLGTKLYRSHGNDYILTVNPICQVIKIEINGQLYLECDLKRIQTVYIQSLVKDAYAKWNSLEEVDGLAHESTSLLTNGEMMGNEYNCNEQSMVIRSYVGQALLTDGSSEVDSMPNNQVQLEDYSEWALNSGFYLNTQGQGA